MCFGLPGRTIRVTTELVTIPLYWFWFQSAETMPGVDQALHVGLERELDDVGRLAGLDRTALVAGRSERVGEVDVLAVGRVLEARLEALLVDLLRSRVRDEVEGAAARAARGDADGRSESDGGDAQAAR